MKETQGRKENTKKDLQTLLIVIAAFVVVTALGVFAFLRFYNSYIDGVLYQERLSQMKEVTTQLFSGLEDVVSNQWNDVDAFCNYVEVGKPSETETLLTFMQKQSKLNNMSSSGKDLIAIDNLGRYLTQDGWQGTLEEMNLLLDKPERLSFVSKSLTTGETRMYFLRLLPEPVEMQDDDRSVQLIYYGISQDMKQLNSYFSCGAYDNSNSVYVLNQKGMKLFRSNDNNELVEGYNAYSVLEGMEYLHEHSFEDAKADLEESGCGYANAIMNGEEYYYALYKMEHAEWTLLFLVPSSYVATNVVSMVSTTVKLILVFAVILVSIAATLIFLIVYWQQKKAVVIERQNSSRLSEALVIAEHAEQKATEASRAKSEFLSNMSHDIRTPMNAIVGITKLMEHDKRDPEKMDTYIQKIQLSSRHLLSLINDVLDMSKIESSSVTLNKEPVKLSEQIGQIESIVRPQIEDRKQNLDIQIHDIVHENLIGDAVRLRQILINLLSNAIKYTPNGGNITLEFAELPCDVPDSAKFCVSVTDTGYGMTKEFVEHIFEPFTRAENSTTNKVQGTGLGMAITKNIVDLMGGTINVQSEVNKGSRFDITITLAIDKASAVTLPCRNFLLISDENDLVQNARAAFSENDAVLNIAQSEAEADEILLREPVEVVLLGGRLMGQQLADGIKKLREKTGKALLLYCCDYSEHDQLDRISENGGIDGVLARPFFLSNLAKAIDRVQSKAPDDSEESGSILNGMRFLCAEDNALNAEILEAILDMNNASCVIYPNGKEISEAFENVKEGDFDAILMDVQMPVMNGLDASRVIRRSSNPLGKTIPIIAMTANAFSEDVQNCLNAGMDAHISKPLDIAVLERTLQSIKSRLNRHTV